MLQLATITLLIKLCVSFDHNYNHNKLGGVECMELHCHTEWVACESDAVCIDNLACNSYCMETWDDDPTQQKVHAQNCTMKCSASFQDDITDTYMACMFNHNCLVMPPINITCPVSQLSKDVEANASLTDLSGEWWQHYGYNALWDCYPCQHIHSMYVYNESEWAYIYSYEIYLVNNSLEYYGQTWFLPYTPNKSGVPVNITYFYLGTPHNETWYILSATERYVVLVDCSYISAWTNVGSIVWVRPNITLTQTEMNKIANVYQQSLGWNFPQQFCKTQHGETCPTSKKIVTNDNKSKHPQGSIPRRQYVQSENRKEREYISRQFNK